MSLGFFLSSQENSLMNQVITIFNAFLQRIDPVFDTKFEYEDKDSLNILYKLR